MLRAVVGGAGGRMGARVIHVLKESSGIRLVGAIERTGHPALGQDAGELAGAGTMGVPLLDDASKVLPGADVWIDFSEAQAALSRILACAEAGKPAVVGTTGFSPVQRSQIEEAAARIPLLAAPNMSVGMNLLFRLVAETARVLGEEYDVEIWEAHHRGKKDAPSGSALRLGEVAAEALGRDFRESAVYSRKGLVGERKKEEIGMQVVRAGDIVGDHTVLFGGLGERLELTHRAHSRDTFARGAVRGALWIAGKPAGLYDMQDVLGLRERG